MQWNTRLSDAAWPARLAALAVFAALGASSVLWSLRWPAAAPSDTPAPPPPPETPAPPPSAQALLRALGAAAPAGAASQPGDASLVLTGVVAQAGGQGRALIAVSGAAQKSFSVGSVVAPGLVLQAVQARRALLGPQMHGPATLTLDLPASPAVLP